MVTEASCGKEYEIDITKMGQNYPHFLTVYHPGTQLSSPMTSFVQLLLIYDSSKFTDHSMIPWHILCTPWGNTYSVASYIVPLMLWLMHVHIIPFITVKHTFVISWPPFCTLHRRYPQSKVQQQYWCCLSNPPQSEMKASTPVHMSDNDESTDFYCRLAHNLVNHKRNEKENYNTSLFQFAPFEYTSPPPHLPWFHPFCLHRTYL